MKRLFLSSLALTALFFGSCSKDSDNTDPVIDPPNGEDAKIYDATGNWTAATLQVFEDNTIANANANGADESVFDWTIAKGGIQLDTEWSEAEILEGEITSDLTLTAARYELRGAVFVRNGATLTIPAGTKFYADPTNNAQSTNAVNSTDVLVVKQGGKLIANGTADNPIVFTSTTQNSGDWGGIVILGNAPINHDNGSANAEVADNVGEELIYGGSQANDNSGSLQYVSLAYPGAQINTEAEFNGFSLYAVGNATTLENLEVYQGKDDAFEFFGGTAEAANLYGNAYDDTFDWTDGWVGGATNIVADQPEGADYCIEADNLSADNNATPRSNPSIKNGTFYSAGNAASAVLLRRGTSIQVDNLIINIANTTEKPNIGIDDLKTAQLLIDGETTLKNVKFDTENPAFGGNANN